MTSEVTAAFDFATATRIVFGAGKLDEVAPAARRMGQRALVVTGRTTARSAGLVAQLEAAGVASVALPVDGEPAVGFAREGAKRAHEEQCDLVIAFGGGSAIDAGKAIAALTTNAGDVLDYLEVIGQAQPLPNRPAPFIAVPTTAGTGSEVTRNAVLGSPQHKLKASLRSPLMLPALAVIDPELTLDLPRPVTARTGLDALTQLIEPYVSARANPMTDMFAVEGMRCVARSLAAAWENGHDRAARAGMSFAALLGGLSLANAGLGVVHGFAAPIGGMFDAPHGAVCAALLPHGVAANIAALRRRQPHSEALARYEHAARILTGNAAATPDDLTTWLKDLCMKLETPPLRTYGITEHDAAALVERAAKASSMRANPIVLETSELRDVLLPAL